MQSAENETLMPVKSPNKHKIFDVLFKGSEILIVSKSHGKPDIFPIDYLIKILIEINESKSKNGKSKKAKK